MTQIKIAVQGSRAALLSPVDLVAGTVGQECIFYFDDFWNQLNKVITYKVGSTIVASEPIENNKVIMPPKVLANSGYPLEVGFTGRSLDNKTVVNTLWCHLGVVLDSAYASAAYVGTQIVYDGGVII